MLTIQFEVELLKQLVKKYFNSLRLLFFWNRCSDISFQSVMCFHCMLAREMEAWTVWMIKLINKAQFMYGTIQMFTPPPLLPHCPPPPICHSCSGLHHGLHSRDPITVWEPVFCWCRRVRRAWIGYTCTLYSVTNCGRGGWLGEGKGGAGSLAASARNMSVDIILNSVLSICV